MNQPKPKQRNMKRVNQHRQSIREKFGLTGDKDREEAGDVSRAMTLEGVRWRRKNFWANEGQTTRDFDILLNLLSSRDTEIRKVLEGLASKHYVSLGEYCWCRAPGTATKPAGDYHGDACLAARGLWERVQVDVKKEESNVAE